jgi:uncharacterized protein (TIGR03118 family)
MRGTHDVEDGEDKMLHRSVSITSVAALALLLGAPAQAGSLPRAATGDSNSYRVHRLVSDQPGMAAQLDPNLVNAWGLVASPTSPWWVADNGTNKSTLYDGDGNLIPLVVKVTGAPTGTVFNGGSDFVVSHHRHSGPSVFIFSTEDGTIHGWNPAVPPPGPSTRAYTVVDRSAEGAIYKGLAIASGGSGARLYATDFHNGRVDVFDGNFDPVERPGAFTDPGLPAGFAPFGIQTVGDHVIVTYAKQDADAEDEIAGPGLGYVDMYSRRGDLLERVASAGDLNAPWGVALAPADFGAFGGDLLIGNFGDGVVNAYAPTNSDSFEPRGALHRRNGNDLAIDGLWAIEFGNGGAAGPTDSLYFTAGPDEEEHGLFGSIEVSSPPAALGGETP